VQQEEALWEQQQLAAAPRISEALSFTAAQFE
jgi:hypothetical protein